MYGVMESYKKNKKIKKQKNKKQYKRYEHCVPNVCKNYKL